MIKSRSLTGCERERSKQNISWIISLSKNDTEKISAKLTETPGLASIICHLTGLAPLHWAVRHNNKKLVQALLRDYNVSPNQKSKSGYTPLHYAAIYGRREVYKLLLDLKADPNIFDFSGMKASAYIDNNLGYGANNKGMNKMWQDLAVDVQNYQKQCFDEQNKDIKANKQEQKCFEGIKKRHSIGF